ncbi:TPA: lipase, partial [Candidatus Latescibacteria bacterium]|nr:lipase [Candidatus Latescibacterota bacterium]
MPLVILSLVLSMFISKHADVPPGVTVDRDLVYATVDGKDLKLDVYWHPDATKPMPLVVWVHGGAWRKGSKKNPRAKGLLDKRYAVASVQYRLSQEAIFPAQIHDCKAAIRWLRSNAAKYKVDPDRFGVWGVSAGGHLVALLGTSGDVEELEGDLGVTGVSSRVQAVS